jgi:hypothetical protein
MTWRPYFADIIGSGASPADGYRPVIADIVSVWRGVDARQTSTGSGRMLAVADVTPAEHTTLIGTAGVTYIPFEDASTAPVDLVTGTVGDVSAANRTLISSRLEAQHIPTQDFTLATPLRIVLARIKRRFVLRQILGTDDWTEGLDTLVSAIAAPRRNAIANRLAARGIDTSAIQGADTIREAIRKVAQQDVAVLRTPEDG